MHNENNDIFQLPRDMSTASQYIVEAVMASLDVTAVLMSTITVILQRFWFYRHSFCFLLFPITV